MQPAYRSPAPSHLAFVGACLLLATYLPTWHKLWFVAESGHYGGGHYGDGTVWVWLLLLGLYRRWRPARVLTYVNFMRQLLIGGCIMLPHNITTGDPILGFALTSSLSLAGLLVLHYSSAIRRYLDGPLPTTR